MADLQSELSQSGTTLYLKPANGFERSTSFGASTSNTHSFTGSIATLGLVSAYGVGNSATIGNSVTVPADYNFVMYGPITVSTGVSLTVGSDANLKIKDISDV
mgnify:CR=1 FL=1|tara:strand:+ start:23 stop:331 length:309 start_codon:yes stop_codon:yes gene_type:complete